MNEEFALYDLEIEVIGDSKTFVCSHETSKAFKVIGENLIFESSNSFSLYALAALLPLIPAKQRQTHTNDWMTTDTDIACPDPNCGALFRINRTSMRTFKHNEVTKVPLLNQEGPAS